MSTTVAEPTRALPTALEPMSHRHILEAMTGLLAALFTAMLSSTIVATALPTIIGDLHGTQRQYTWVITAALLATTVSTPIWGKLSDLFSKKLLVQLSIIVFVLGSIAAGMAHNVPFLIACRVVQGLGMGGLTALVQSIMGSIISPRDRGRYSGYMGAVMAVSTVSGPLLGGVIVDSPLGWRWCFYVCVPLAVISLFILQATLHVETERRQVSIDYVGALLISLAASLPLLWVTFAGQDFAWMSWQTAAYLGATAVAVVLAVVVELKVPEPLVPLKVLRNRTAALVIVASAAVGIAMFGGTTFLGQYFQVARGYSPTHAGLLTIPLMAGLLVSSTGAGQIISRTGRWKKFLVGGGIFLVVGLFGLGTLDHTTPLWQVGIYMAVMGIGLGAMMQNLVLAVQNTVDVRDIGAASATVAFFRTLGGAVGVSVLGAVLATRVQDSTLEGLRHLSKKAAAAAAQSQSKAGLDLAALPAPVRTIVRQSYGDATGRVFVISAIVAVVALLCVVFIKEVPLRTTVKLGDSAENATAGVAGTASPAERSPEVTATAGTSDTSRASHTSGTVAANGSAAANGATVGVGVHRARVANPERIQASSAQLDDPVERTAVGALDVLTAAQDTARRHVTASREARAEVSDLLGAVGGEVEAALAQFQRSLADIRQRLVSDEVTGRSEGRDGTGGDSLRSYEYGLLLNTQQTVNGMTLAAQREAQRIVDAANAEVAALEQRIERLRSVEAELSDGVSSSLRGHAGR
jgi:EmrB/QacA subfamily drug resistance transporter